MGKKARQIFSGLLSLLTLFSVVTQPLMGLASEMPETEAYEVEYPPLEAVKDLLAEDEIVTAEDYILDAGSIFDIGHDFADMEINPDKVKNEEGQEFDINQTGTYKAVYFVEPLSGNPKYHICRALTVREPETVPQAVLSDEDENSEDAGNDDGAGLYLPEQAAVPESLENAADGAPAPEAEKEFFLWIDLKSCAGWTTPF